MQIDASAMNLIYVFATAIVTVTGVLAVGLARGKDNAKRLEALESQFRSLELKVVTNEGAMIAIANSISEVKQTLKDMNNKLDSIRSCGFKEES